MASNFCANCGSPLTPETSYCPNCGAPAPQYIVKQKIPGRGLAIAAMVLGILAVVFGLSVLGIISDEIAEAKDYGTEFLKLAGFGDYLFEEYSANMIIPVILSVLSICFSVGARSKQYRSKKGTAGLVLGIIGLVAVVLDVICCVPYL